MANDLADLTTICEGFIWGLNPASLREQPLVSPESWAGAVQHELVKFGMGGSLQTPKEAGKPYLAVAAVMMVKDESDIIGENLVWMYFTGVRRFIILDNASQDDTAAIIERFRRAARDAEVLVLNDPLVRYMQSEKTTGLYRLALSIWPDVRWVIPVDADEFLIAEKGLGVFDQIEPQVDAISIPKVIHFQQRFKPNAATSVMGRMTYRSPIFCVPPKIVVKFNFFTTITQGNHKIRLIDERPPVYAGGFGMGLYYREFPTRSFEHFLRKVHNGGRAIKSAEAYLGRKVGGEHWVAYHNELLTGGEERLLAIYKSEWVRDSVDGFVTDPFLVDASSLH